MIALKLYVFLLMFLRVCVITIYHGPDERFVYFNAYNSHA